MAEDLVGLGNAVGPLTEAIAELVRKMFGPAADEIGELLGAYVARRKINAKRTVDGAAQILYERNTEPKPVALKIIFPILEGCSLEDQDDNLASKWAGLLASAAAGDPVHASYPKILAELTPAKARLLDAMYQCLVDRVSHEKQTLFTVRELSEKMQLSSEQFVLAISNLARHRLCDLPVYREGSPLLYRGLVNKCVNGIRRRPLVGPRRFGSLHPYTAFQHTRLPVTPGH